MKKLEKLEKLKKGAIFTKELIKLEKIDLNADWAVSTALERNVCVK